VTGQDRLDGLAVTALVLAVLSIGLPWAVGVQASGGAVVVGYESPARVLIAAALVLVVLGWRHGSRPLAWAGFALGIASVAIDGSQLRSGALVMLIAMGCLATAIRRAPFP
jgi:hypothetical protein